jgi:hypothetical protein
LSLFETPDSADGEPAESVPTGDYAVRAPEHGPVPLRPWQYDALAQFEASSSPNFLAVATPGAG